MFAVTNQEVVIDFMEFERPVLLQGRIFTTDAVHRRNQIAQTFGLIYIPVPELVLFRIQILFVSRMHWTRLKQLERRAVNSIVRAKRRRKQKADHERGT